MTPFDEITPTGFRKKGTLIAQKILESIKNGQFEIGTRLPPERVIAEKMGVSRPSVREAVSALQIVGVLESRPGDGNYVTRLPLSESTISQTLLVLEESDSPFEIIQARKVIEIGVARLVVETSSDDDIRQIREIWEIKKKVGQARDYEGFIQRGKSFHLALARAANNTIIESMMANLLNATLQPLWLSMRKIYYQEDVERIEGMLRVHEDIVRSLEQRNAEKACLALEEHFDYLVKQLYQAG